MLIAEQTLLRPHNGDIDVGTIVHWSLDTLDYKPTEPEMLADRMAPAAVEDGEVVLLHEGKPWTLAALELALPRLRDAGVALVTVGQLRARYHRLPCRREPSPSPRTSTRTRRRISDPAGFSPFLPVRNSRLEPSGAHAIDVTSGLPPGMVTKSLWTKGAGTAPLALPARTRRAAAAMRARRRR